MKDVHTEHCCKRHGCKYGYMDDSDCTVMSGKVPQSYPCESCMEDITERIGAYAARVVAVAATHVEWLKNHGGGRRFEGYADELTAAVDALIKQVDNGH